MPRRTKHVTRIITRPPAPTPTVKHEPMTKGEFITQYALNRALGAVDSLSGQGAVREGLRAWNEIQKSGVE